MFYCIHMRRGSIGGIVPISHHIAGIAVQGRSGIRVTEKCQDSSTSRLQPPRRRPFFFQNIQTNITSSKVDIGVKDLRKIEKPAPLFYLARFNLQVLSTKSILYSLSKINITRRLSFDEVVVTFDSSWCVEHSFAVVPRFLV
jgi:hypothetical protein